MIMALYSGTSCSQNERTCFEKIKRESMARDSEIAGVTRGLMSFIAAVLALGILIQVVGIDAQLKES